MKNLAIALALLLAAATVSALPYNQQVQDQKEQACKQCLIMVEKESMILVTCNWVVEKDLFKPNLKKGFAYKRLVRKDPFHYEKAIVVAFSAPLQTHCQTLLTCLRRRL